MQDLYTRIPNSSTIYAKHMHKACEGITHNFHIFNLQIASQVMKYYYNIIQVEKL